MKNKIYITGILTVILIFTGALFKVQHWPAAGVMLTLGLASLVLLFLPLAIADHYRSNGKKYPVLHFITWLTCFVIFTAMLFKLMHWPYAGIGLLLALPFPYVVFLPVFIYTTSKDKNFNINNLIAVLLLLAINSVFSGLLALNVTRDSIMDSYNLSRDYIFVDNLASKLPVLSADNEVIQKIDNTVGILTDYEEIILKAEESQVKSFTSPNPDLSRPDAKGIASEALLVSGEAQYGSKLAEALRELTDALGKTREYSTLVNRMPEITGFPATGDITQWADATFKDNACLWTLTYLEGLKANLLTLRASLL